MSTPSSVLSDPPPSTFSQDPFTESIQDASRRNSQISASDNGLPRLGRSNQYVQWLPAYNDEFIAWWIGTSWVLTRAASGSGIDYVKTVGWATKHTASCWESFYQAARKDGEPVIVCTLCLKALTHPSSTPTSTGTTSMRNHLKSAQCLRSRSSRQSLLSFTSNVNHSTEESALTQPVFNAQVLRTIVSCRGTFRMVEDPEWKKLCFMQNPLFNLPSASTIRTCLFTQLGELEETFLTSVVPNSKVALSLDCWSSKSRTSFMGVIAHWIDKEWNLRSQLIGFEPIETRHTGDELAAVLQGVTDKYRLTKRISAITTDNASNNDTLLTSVNKSLSDMFEHSSFMSGQIQHVPCISHVFQLALQALLGTIRIAPTNDEFLRNWDNAEERQEIEGLTASENTRQSREGIPFILAKIRKLSKFVNSSSARKTTFNQAQDGVSDSHQPRQRLLLLQDVKTRWDSTCHMLIRARRLRSAIDSFCDNYRPATPYTITDIEWKKIEYLIDITRPFALFTQTLGRTHSVTIPYAMAAYDVVFERLVESRRRLLEKEPRRPWVRSLINAIDAAEQKLEFYYNRMYGELGSLYAIAAILNPNAKSDSFNPEYCWLNTETRDWKSEFEDQFRKLYERSYQTNNAANSRRLQQLRQESRDPLQLVLDSSRLRPSSDIRAMIDEEDEVDAWIESRKDARPPLVAWKAKEHELPGIAAMARDLLCIPMAGVGVERCFSFARDQCSLKRGQLAPDTLRALMIVYWSLVNQHTEYESRDQLSSVDISDMTAQQIEDEIALQEEDIRAHKAAAGNCDEDHFISDQDEVIAGPRTSRAALRKSFQERHRRRLQDRQAGLVVVNQSLSDVPRRLAALESRRAAESDERSRRHPSIFDVPDDNLPLSQSLRRRRRSSSVSLIHPLAPQRRRLNHDSATQLPQPRLSSSTSLLPNHRNNDRRTRQMQISSNGQPFLPEYHEEEDSAAVIG